MNSFENQWIEIFHTGEQTDSSGNIRKWTTPDLEKIVRNYNAKKHEAPVVIGHPKDNAPAFGWVAALRTDGKSLFAKFKQLVPEFIDAVKKGLYKKRSISIYPDLTLRHVGFLGAVPPAVKGLADIKFMEKDSITITWLPALNESWTGKDRFHTLCRQSAKTDTHGKESNFMTERKTNAENSCFIPGSAKDKEINRLKEQLEKEQQKNRIAKFREFVNLLHSEGKIVSDFQNTAIDLMEAMYEAGEVNFSEGKANALDKFKEYLKNQPKMIDFEEKARGDMVNLSTASEQLNILAIEKARDAKITFSEALSIIQSEYPELAQKTAQEL